MTGERSPTMDAALPLPVLAGLQKAVDYLDDGRSSEAEQHARQVLGLCPDDGSTPNVIGAVTEALRRAESPART